MVIHVAGIRRELLHADQMHEYAEKHYLDSYEHTLNAITQNIYVASEQGRFSVTYDKISNDVLKGALSEALVDKGYTISPLSIDNCGLRIEW